MRKIFFRVALVIFVLILVFLFFRFNLRDLLTLENIKSHQRMMRSYAELYPGYAILWYLVIYSFISVLGFFPGAIILALAAGAIFGFWLGSVLVILGSAFGAMLTFLIVRGLAREFVQKKYGMRFRVVNEQIVKEGPYYLFFMRVAPMLPFSLTNMAMGLSPISLWTFFWVSCLGMIPGTVVYVNGGRELARISSVSDIMSPTVVLSILVSGFLPFGLKKIRERVLARRARKE